MQLKGIETKKTRRPLSPAQPATPPPILPPGRHVQAGDEEGARERFLKALREGFPVSTAAETAGIARATVYRWRDEDEGFLDSWEDAYKHGSDFIENVARHRAVEGWDEPVFWDGEEVGHVRKYSDRMLDRLLKGRKKDVYGDAVTISTAPSGVQPDDPLGEVARRLARIAERTRPSGVPRKPPKK